MLENNQQNDDDQNGQQDRLVQDVAEWLRTICGNDHPAALAAGLSELAGTITPEFRSNFNRLPDSYFQAASAFHRVVQWW